MINSGPEKSHLSEDVPPLAPPLRVVVTGQKKKSPIKLTHDNLITILQARAKKNRFVKARAF